ncbi:MAG: hypothetical protein ACJA1C_002810 [Crocinitomicaceae bacterium]|jgi:hypothetical protein
MLKLILASIALVSFTVISYAQTNKDDSTLNAVRQLNNSDLLQELRSPTSRIDLSKIDVREEVIQKLDALLNEEFEAFKTKKHSEYKAFRKANKEIHKLPERCNKFTTDKNSRIVSWAEYRRWLWEKYRAENLYQNYDLLFESLRIGQEHVDGDSKDEVRKNLEKITTHNTLQQILELAVRTKDTTNYFTLKHPVRSRDVKLIQEHLLEYEQGRFVHYTSTDIDPKKVKEIDFNTDNDVLTPAPDVNQDREYTGGGRLTLSTDYFKARWLNLAWLNFFQLDKSRHRKVMTYQSMSIGMHFYTPYIRYQNDTDLADTLFQFDRPFGSYIYLERSKYRLWSNGLFRHHGAFQVGQIGANAGRDIQALLHRDAVVESQKVYGWDKQVANGGRWLIQINHELDVLLFSTTNERKSVFSKSKNKNWEERYSGFNVIATSELLYGGYLAAGGLGLRLSGSDFTNQSGQSTVRERRKRKYEFGFNWELGFKWRYVNHSSLLEGFGYTRTFVDDKYDDDAESAYTLNQASYLAQDTTTIEEDQWFYDRPVGTDDQVNRHVWMVDLKLSFRWRKMTAYFVTGLYRKEYKSFDLDFDDYSSLAINPTYYNEKVKVELNSFQNKDYYSFGKVGVSWLL